MKVTLFTPTYNRAYILGQLYRSIQRQTYRDFEWLIIDDGSSDNTEELVVSWINENNDFPIRYFKQENGGKCRAINRALDLAEGELFMGVDSDDYLTRDAIEKIVMWESMLPANMSFCGVAGNMGVSETKSINHEYISAFHDGTLLDSFNYNGERVIAFYTDIYRQYSFPVFPEEKFMTEAIVYNRMAHDGYKMRFYNDIICVYEYRDDGLTKAGNRLFLQNPQGYGLWLREKEEFMRASLKSRFRLWYTYYCEMTFCEEQYRLTKKQCAEYIGAPLWAMYASAVLHKLKTTIKG